MPIAFWVLVAILANFFVGALVWSMLDEEGRIFGWYDSCPPEIAWFTQPLILQFWPFAFWAVSYAKREAKHEKSPSADNMAPFSGP